MARKTLELTAAGARYGTRMLKAGDPIELSGPNARLYAALGWAGESARLKGAERLPEQRADPVEPVERKQAKKRKARAKK